MVPKTTNKTAGHTPFPAFARNIKRKLEYSSTGKVQRNVRRGKLLSMNEQKNQNKLFFDILPDGVAVFYAARGTPNGPVGYIQPLIKALEESILDENSNWSELLRRHHVTSILPLKELSTGMAKKLNFAGGTKQMDVKGIVYLFDTVKECNEQNCNMIATNLIREASSTFKIRISLGGNAAKFGGEVFTSLDSKFLTEDVANLAMMSYRESILDKSFFEDNVLVNSYFHYCADVQQLFSDIFGV